mmetsp:Transcript_9346/g.24485  ORF Transcript_9346/g.24485 Transcript_9346/m.24485 type:complete len:419 (-) Transcript_9346:95-1351(-)
MASDTLALCETGALLAKLAGRAWGTVAAASGLHSGVARAVLPVLPIRALATDLANSGVRVLATVEILLLGARLARLALPLGPVTANRVVVAEIAGFQVAASQTNAVRVCGARLVLVLVRAADGTVHTLAGRQGAATLEPLVVAAVLAHLALPLVQVHASASKLAFVAPFARLALAFAHRRVLGAAALPHLTSAAPDACLTGTFREAPTGSPEAPLVACFARLAVALHARPALAEGTGVTSRQTLARGTRSVLGRRAGFDLVLSRPADGALSALPLAFALAPSPVRLGRTFTALFARPLAPKPTRRPVGPRIALWQAGTRKALTLLGPLALGFLVFGRRTLYTRLARALVQSPTSHQIALRRAAWTMSARTTAQVDTPLAVFPALTRPAGLALAACHGRVGEAAPLAHLAGRTARASLA